MAGRGMEGNASSWETNEEISAELSRRLSVEERRDRSLSSMAMAAECCLVCWGAKGRRVWNA